MPTIARTAASITGLVAVLLLVLYLAYGSGNGGDSNATPAPSALVAASPTARPLTTASPSPSPSYLRGDLRGTSVIPLRQGDPIDLPDNIALIIETGCWQCDGPATGLDRVYRDPSGNIRTETLVSAELLGITKPSGNPPVILGFDALDNASWIVVAFCTAGDCGWLGLPDIDARTTFFESMDGGVTWSEIAELAGTYAIVTLAPATSGRERDVIIRGPLHPDLAPSGSQYRYLATREPVQPPPEAWGEAYPRIAPSREIIWQTHDVRLVTSSGETFLFGGADFRPAGDFVSDSNGTRWGVPWTFDAGNQPSPYLLTLTDVNGTVIRTLESANYMEWGVSSGGNVVYGNAELDRGLLADVTLHDPISTFFPVQIHLNEATFYPILNPFTGYHSSSGRNRVIAVQRGPFVRVVGAESSCLNVRDIPVVDAGINACADNGVLLSVGRSDESGEWIEVTTPDGVYGWAATEFLEY